MGNGYITPAVSGVLNTLTCHESPFSGAPPPFLQGAPTNPPTPMHTSQCSTCPNMCRLFGADRGERGGQHRAVGAARALLCGMQCSMGTCMCCVARSGNCMRMWCRVGAAVWPVSHVAWHGEDVAQRGPVYGAMKVAR